MSESQVAESVDNLAEAVVALAVTGQTNRVLGRWAEDNDMAVSVAIAYREKYVTGVTDSGKQVMQNALIVLASALQITESELMRIALDEPKD
jgi:cyanophycinase-like exopeptidase